MARTESLTTEEAIRHLEEMVRNGYSNAAIEALQIGYAEAERSKFYTTGHLMLGLMHRGLSARLLAQEGVGLEDARDIVNSAYNTQTNYDHHSFTPRTVLSLATAQKLASDEHASRTTSLHILRGVMHVDTELQKFSDGAQESISQRLGLDPERIISLAQSEGYINRDSNPLSSSTVSHDPVDEDKLLEVQATFAAVERFRRKMYSPHLEHDEETNAQF